MGLFNLSRLCLAVFSFSALAPALAADPPAPRGNVSVTVNPTTGYYSSTNSTVRLPSGVSASPTTGLPVVSKYSGGLQQSIPTGITIDAIKKSAPLSAVARATDQTLKAGAKRLLKGNLAGLALGAGLSSLLAGIDALIDDSGKVTSLSPTITTNLDGYVWYSSLGHFPGFYASPAQACQAAGNSYYFKYESLTRASATRYECVYSHSDKDKHTFGIQRSGNGCVGDYTYNSNLGACVRYSEKPLTSSEIDDAVDDSYNPEPSDWPVLTPHFTPDDIEITSAPTLQSEPKTTTVYDADGNPHEITETNIWYDFDIRDNGSSQPALDLKTREETKTYKNGALTGSTTTESTTSSGSGGGGAPSSEIDIPTDCDFMPTVCAFLDWVKNDDTPEDPDLSALIDDRDFTESYSISGGSKQCPPPYEFTVDFIGRTYGLSFEPACDFASKMYYFVMAAAYIFAAYITVGAAKNG